MSLDPMLALALSISALKTAHGSSAYYASELIGEAPTYQDSNTWDKCSGYQCKNLTGFEEEWEIICSYKKCFKGSVAQAPMTDVRRETEIVQKEEKNYDCNFVVFEETKASRTQSVRMFFQGEASGKKCGESYVEGAQQVLQDILDRKVKPLQVGFPVVLKQDLHFDTFSPRGFPGGKFAFRFPNTGTLVNVTINRSVQEKGPDIGFPTMLAVRTNNGERYADQLCHTTDGFGEELFKAENNALTLAIKAVCVSQRSPYTYAIELAQGKVPNQIYVHTGKLTSDRVSLNTGRKFPLIIDIGNRKTTVPPLGLNTSLLHDTMMKACGEFACDPQNQAFFEAPEVAYTSGGFFRVFDVNFFNCSLSWQGQYYGSAERDLMFGYINRTVSLLEDVYQGPPDVKFKENLSRFIDQYHPEEGSGFQKDACRLTLEPEQKNRVPYITCPVNFTTVPSILSVRRYKFTLDQTEPQATFLQYAVTCTSEPKVDNCKQIRDSIKTGVTAGAQTAKYVASALEVASAVAAPLFVLDLILTFSGLLCQ